MDFLDGIGKLAILMLIAFFLLIGAVLGTILLIRKIIEIRKSPNKECPFCAAIIPSGAIICPICRKELP